MRKIVLACVVGGSVCIAILLGARNELMRELVERQVRNTTGFPLEIESFYWNWRTGWVYCRNLTLQNPPGFQEPVFAKAQELYVQLDWRSLLRGRPHVKYLLLNINEIQFIKHRDGTTNARRLGGVRSPRPRRPLQFQFDTVRLIVDTVCVTDETRLLFKRRAYRLRIDQTYHNVTAATDINRLLLVTVMKRVPFDPGLTINKLTEGLETVVGLPADILKGTAGVLQKTGEVVGDAITGKKSNEHASP